MLFQIVRMNTSNTHGFGRIPDPPEPPEDECNGEYVEGSCECCSNYEECKKMWKEEEV